MRIPRSAAKSSPRLPQLEKAMQKQWRPSAAKNRLKKKKKNGKKIRVRAKPADKYQAALRKEEL